MIQTSEVEESPSMKTLVDSLIEMYTKSESTTIYEELQNLHTHIGLCWASYSLPFNIKHNYDLLLLHRLETLFTREQIHKGIYPFPTENKHLSYSNIIELCITPRREFLQKNYEFLIYGTK